MEKKFDIGNVINGFEVLETRALEDITSFGYVMKHKVSGADLVWLDNDDAEKAFSITFNTPPVDDSGVFHIIEHSVLCGSKRYPVKKPFTHLLASSAQTFLNAMTGPTYTTYPLSTTNNIDFMNLMRVYMDAVSNPFIAHDKDIFLQEGWHYTYDSEKLDASGVVLNEMKGALSSSGALAYQELKGALFPSSTLSCQSGGKPKSIIDLPYEQLVDTYKRHYRPDNCIIALSGNPGIENILKALDEEFLTPWAASVEEEINLNPVTKTVANKPGFKTIYAPIDENTSCAFWAVGKRDNIDPNKRIAINLLNKYLLGENDSPLSRELLNEGLATGFGPFGLSECQYMFGVSAIVPQEGCAQKLLEIMPDLLRKQAKSLDKESLDAIIDSLEYSSRISSENILPRLYVINDSWKKGEDLFDQFEVGKTIEWLRDLPLSYFEALLLEFANNTNTYAVEIFKGETDDNLSNKLSAIEATMSKDNLTQIAEEAQAFEARRAEPDSEEALAKLPLLRLEDMDDPAKYPTFEIEDYRGADLQICDIPTNGLAYMSVSYDISQLDVEDICYLTLFSILVSEFGIEGVEPQELIKGKNRYLGAFGFSPFFERSKEGNLVSRANISLSTLESNIEAGAKLAFDMIAKANLGNTEKVIELFQQVYASTSFGMMQVPHMYASARAAAMTSAEGAANDYVSGLASYEFIQELAQSFTAPEGFESFMQNLCAIKAKILALGPATLIYAGPESGLNAFKTSCDILFELANPEAIPVAKNPIGKIQPLEGDEFRMTIKGNVSYVARSISFEDGIDADSTLTVSSDIIKNKTLWDLIRVKGGAYGAFLSVKPRNHELALMTYRDPNPETSVEVFNNLADYVRKLEVSQEELESCIVSQLANLDSPMKASQKVAALQIRYLLGLNPEGPIKTREKIRTCDKSCFERLAKALESGKSATVIFEGE